MYIIKLKERSNKIVFAAEQITMFLFLINAAEKILQISKTNDQDKPNPRPTAL